MNSEFVTESSMVLEIVFWAISVISIISALGVVLLKSVFRAALSLIICFITIAAFFILLNAEFLAAVQILIYIGAISVLLIFAILFTRDIDIQNVSHKFNLITAIVVGVFCLISIYIFNDINIKDITKDEASYLYGSTVNEIGRLLVNNFVLPFEVVSILLLAALIGAFVGAIPAAGSAIGVTVSYAQEKRMSKNPEKYGTGIPEGIVAPESSNNACVGGALIPLMTLGIPGDSMTAVLVGAMLIHGLRPGPQLFVERLDFVALIYVALILAIILTTMLALLTIRYIARILDAPKNILMIGITILCMVGSYAVRNSIFDVMIMIIFGFIGYLMQKIQMPVAPVVFGLVLGPLLEENIRRSLIVSAGDWSVFFERPISLIFILISVLALALPIFSRSKNQQ